MKVVDEATAHPVPSNIVQNMNRERYRREKSCGKAETSRGRSPFIACTLEKKCNLAGTIPHLCGLTRYWEACGPPSNQGIRVTNGFC